MKNDHISLRDIGIAVLAPVYMILVQDIIFTITAVSDSRDDGFPSSLLSYAVILLTAVGAYIRCPRLFTSSNDGNISARKNRAGINIRHLLRGFVIIILLCAAGISLQLFSSGILNMIDSCRPELLQSYREMTSSSFSLKNGALRVFSVALLAPVCEELIFRGITLHSLERAFSFSHSKAAAILVSAVLFGLFHGNLVQFCYALPAGILLAMLTEWTASLLPGIILHITINCSGYIIDRLPLPDNEPLFIICYGVICAVCFLCIYVFSSRDTSHKIF